LFQGPNALANPVVVDGFTYGGPWTGVVASSTDSGGDNAAVYVINGGTIAGANGWIVTSNYASAYGIFVDNGDTYLHSYFSGSNLSVTTSSNNAYGIYANNGHDPDASSTIIVASSTVNTLGSHAYGLAVNGGECSVSGVDVWVTTGGNDAYGVLAYTGTIIVASSTVNTSGGSAHGLYAINGGSVSGTDLLVTTNNMMVHGAYANGTSNLDGHASTITLTSSTLKTSGTYSFGLYAENGGSISGTGLEVKTLDSTSGGIWAQNSGTVAITDGTFDVAAGMVLAGFMGANDVTLTNATATNLGNGNVFYSLGFDAHGSNTLTIERSTLAGNLDFSASGGGGNSTNTLNLVQGSTLTGKSTRSANTDHTLSVNIGATSTWNVIDRSTLSDLTVDGTLGVLLTGTGYTAALITLDDVTLDLAAHVMPIFDGSFIYGEGINYSYQIFNDDALSGVLGSDYLSLVDWSNLAAGWIVINDSFDDGVLKFGLVQIPEPGTWALMLGGLGVLGYLQRVRRNRK